MQNCKCLKRQKKFVDFIKTTHKNEDQYAIIKKTEESA